MCLYNIAIVLYALAIRLASLWLPKAKLWCEGRKNIFDRIAKAIAPEDRILWVHVASLGEFEQGRPLLEKIRAEHPEYKILLTFFSPSGYELRKNYKGADYIFYLPIDSGRNARKFIKWVHPEIVIFVKYEFWLNMLFELGRSKAKTYIVSAIFRRNSIFFKWYGELWRRALKSFTTIFVQNDESKELLSEINIHNVVVAGDTRFDRVAQIAQEAQLNPIIERFKGATPLLVAGSTWPSDEAILTKIIDNNRDIKFVIAPHEISAERVNDIKSNFANSIKYTDIDEQEALINKQILILDTMGQLSSIYQYASWAYIGGGFGVGIHNTLEAATFGLPIAFGTNYHKFKEAKDMVQLGGCCSVTNKEELDRWFTELRANKELYDKTCLVTKEYTKQQQGASKVIINNIFA